MTGYQAIYKCRLCGEIYNGAFTGNENIAISTAVCACLGINHKEPQSPHLCEIHNCKNGDLGIGDFQGYKKINEEE